MRPPCRLTAPAGRGIASPLMHELTPLPLATLLRRILREWRTDRRIFDLPAARFWRGPADPAVRMGVRCCGQPAGTPLGPAAGPHTQMAQNIVLGWLAGCRIFELKTVQVDDRLTIPRPCIDMTNVGYNVEFSQELRVHQSLEEYVKAWMLLRMMEHLGVLGAPGRPAAERADDGAREPHFHDVVFDLSCGYDLAGLRTRVMRDFINGLLDATPVIERLRASLPDEFRGLRDLDFDPCVSRSVTLSTFHNCPPGEIEGMALHLMREHGLHVVVKMNPTMLGRDRLLRLLHDRMGYTGVRPHEPAFDAGLGFDDAVAMMHRLRDAARHPGLHVGAKFTNTLEVVNHRAFFPATEKVMYLSGAPLHPIAMELAVRFAEAFTAHARANGDPDPEMLPLSFSAGVDRHNFADCVACGFVPVTVCSDLLKPGGYGRAAEYLAALEAAMGRTGARTIDEFITRHPLGGAAADDRDADPRDAALRNHAAVAALAVADTRYARARNAAVPPRVDSHLWMFDCIACDKCVPVCPNNANFTFALPTGSYPYRNLRLAGGALEPADEGALRIARPHQIANFAPFCNECGNCDTFCPEYGGPFIEKPAFHATEQQWRDEAPRDGFWAGTDDDGGGVILGRIHGREYALRVPAASTGGAVWPPVGAHLFDCPAARVALRPDGSAPPTLLDARAPDGALVDMSIHATLWLLLHGVLCGAEANYVNAAAGPEPAPPR